MSALKYSLSSLPEEIQAYILSKLDGVTAATAKCVCHLWNDIISGLEESLHLWLWCCLNELNSYCLVELTQVMQFALGRENTLTELSKDWEISLCDKLPWIFWREVYAEYYRTRYVKFDDNEVTELIYFHGYGEVTCLHLQGNLIFSGHEDGSVVTWKSTDEELQCNVLMKHKAAVTSIATSNMADTIDELMCGTKCNYLVTSSCDTTLMLHILDTEDSTSIKHFSKKINEVRCWGVRFVASADGSMMQGQPVWQVSSGAADIVYQLCGQTASNMTAVAYWNDTVISGDQMGNLFMWIEPRHIQQKNICVSQDMVHLTSFKSPIKSVWLLAETIVCFTASGKLYVSTDGNTFHSHDVYCAVKRSAECVAVRGPLLAIGTRAGFVFLYHLPSWGDWDSLDLSKPARTVKMGSEHINAVAIGDDGSCPIVVIATEEHFISVVKFKKPRRTEETKDSGD